MTIIKEGLVSTDLDVHPSEYKSKECIIRAIRECIISENDATNMYEKLVHSLKISSVEDNELIGKLIDQIQDIANEEKKHIGEFQKLLAILDSTEILFYKQGARE